jgi:inner membrane protein
VDPLTQGLLGAACGQAVYGRALGRRAVIWGAAIGMSPDLDVVLNATGPMGEWLWHRGFTHALWFGPLLGPLPGWLLWRWKGGRLRDWIGLAILALFTHPLLDVWTTYGTQLLAPFSRHRFALDAVGIIDPAYTLVLGAAVVAGRWRGWGSRTARGAAWVALSLSTAYLVAGLEINHRAEVRAAAQLRAEGEVGFRVSAYPTVLQLPLRRIVARRDEEVRIGWLSLLSPRPIDWTCFEDARGPLVDAARGTWEARVLEWFAMGQTAARLEGTGQGAVVEIDDLRYGLPGQPRDGLWGVRVRLDAAGRPTGPGERVNRRPSSPPGELLDQIWRRTLGLSAP